MSNKSLEDQKCAFEYYDQIEDFRELEIDKDMPFKSLLDSELILLFIDRMRKKVWIWIGSNSTTKMKFRAAQASYHIRDHYAFGYRISTVNEGSESKNFKIFIGLEKEEAQKVKLIEPKYKGSSEQGEIFKELNKKNILLILEKALVPKGYKRRLVIVNNEVYLFKIYKREYLSSKVEEKRLFSLKENIEDGFYLMEEYEPRLLFSSNKILLIELLQKVASKTINKQS